MATIDELQAQVLALTEELVVVKKTLTTLIDTAPTQYYTSRHGGEEIDKGIDRAKEGGAIDLALAGKAADWGITLSGVDVLAAARTLKIGTYMVDSTATNAPFPGAYWILDVKPSYGVHLTITLTMLTNNSPKKYYAVYNAAQGTWSSWEPIPTATPPQEYDVPLADGWTHINPQDGLKYGKGGDGKAQLMGIIVAPAQTSPSMQVAIVPEEWRPLRQTGISAIDLSTGKALYLLISTTGVVVFYGSNAPTPSGQVAVPIQSYYVVP